jgi:predicted dehydrogenase
MQSSVGLAAASTLPAWYLEEIDAQANAAAEPTQAPNDQLRIALVGCGGQGTYDAKNAANSARIVAVCDVDAQRVERARQTFPGADGYSDFRKVMERKDVDAVICGTVDHWHTLVSMAAMRAGKDVYCEKPLTPTIDEGKRIVETQRQTGRILQTGTQQRSSAHFRLAVDLIRNGRVGKVQRAQVWLPAGLRGGPFPAAPVPAGFDFDFWLGQTPKVDYVKERTHFSFRYWWEYSGGTITDWGAHHNDIVLWALDMDDSGPVSAEGRALVEMIPGGYTASSEYEITFIYPNGVVHECRSTTASEWNGAVKDPNGQLHGIKFIGSDGWIWVTRGEIKASERSLLTEKLPEAAKRVYVSNDHMDNFVECVKSRKPTICPASVGHRSATVAHLGATAVRLGRKLQWDPVKEDFVNDAEASRWVSRPMRRPYDYSMI